MKEEGERLRAGVTEGARAEELNLALIQGNHGGEQIKKVTSLNEIVHEMRILTRMLYFFRQSEAAGRGGQNKRSRAKDRL